jgi:O-antigen/teichoic acid export membrane protein
VTRPKAAAGPTAPRTRSSFTASASTLVRPRALAGRLLRPHDTSTAEGRAAERHRRIALTQLTSAAARFVGMAVTFVTVPLAVSYLGNERYGMWATLASFTALLGFADLGMANSLVNVLAGAHGASDRESARAYLSTAVFILSGIAFVLGVTFAVLYAFVPWPSVFNVSSDLAVSEAGRATAVFMLTLFVALPIGVVQRIQVAYQEGFSANLWAAAGSLLSLVALLVVMELDLGLPWVVAALAGSPVVAMAVNGFVLFRRRYRWLRPARSAVSRAAGRTVLRMAFVFVTLQAAGAIAFESDSLVIAQILGAEEVTQYAVPLRLFASGGILLTFLLMPLWPAYREAIERGDHGWVRPTFRRSIRLGLLVNVPLAVVLVVLGDRLVRLWVGGDVDPSAGLLVGLGLWLALNGFTIPLAMFFNGAEIIRFQLVCVVLMTVANLGLSIVLVHWIGVAGAIFGTVIAHTAFVLLPSFVYVRRALARYDAPLPAAP